jgi:predicted TIM-barrel fold metal-dependent hydrolase
MVQVLERDGVGTESDVKLAVIDTDVHPAMNPFIPDVMKHMPKRWTDYVSQVGVRAMSPGGDRPRHREYASRWDATPPAGGAPGSNPEFAREQLLDRFEMSGAVLNDIGAFMASGGKSLPLGLCTSLVHGINMNLRENWFASDPRWYGSIATTYEYPELAVKEIELCREDPEYGDRWVQCLWAPDNERPAGNQKYWPIFEACEHYGLPIAFHVLASRTITGGGNPNYYFEEHCDFAQLNFPAVASLIFEGVFDRFPNLNIAMIELGWSWAVPYAWRMDRAYDMMDNESKLERRPSEYLRDHFYFSTQPMEEPDNPAHFQTLLETVEAAGMGDKIMYSSDYPHWDFDEPHGLPQSVKGDQLRDILSTNAQKLYGIDPIPGTGVALGR